MFLKTLTISNGSYIIRDINFRKGINLIVDETLSINKTDSGNSVGKTTVLRLIDFCLDGKGDNIFKDPEFKDTNLKVEKFLKDNNILISLTLIEDFDDDNSETVFITRNFLAYKNKIQTINGKSYDNKTFSSKLSELIFKTTKEQPSFKQLKSKNIRDEKNKLVNTIKVLAPNVVTDVTYESLHLFWFGIDIDSSKDKLIRDKNIEVKLQSRFRRESNLSEINQSLIIIDKEIADLTIKKSKFNINDSYNLDLNLLNEVKFKINKLATTISRLEVRRELILESKYDLDKDVSNIDTVQIKRLYEKAKSYFPNIQKTFEDTLIFHNQMVQQKIKFITEELPELETSLRDLKSTLNSLLSEERELSQLINKSDAIEELQSITAELNLFYEKKGRLEEQKKLWELSNHNLRVINEKLIEINANILSKDELIQNRIRQFNIYFSEISNRLDGVHSLLSADNPEGIYKFKIGNIEGNPGTGSKKSQMASFDLAYIKFADVFEIPCLHFILQDQIENVHSNQITNLLTKIVSEINCQFVLPVLRDKLPVDMDYSYMEILSLSQKEKLFKI